MTADLTLFDGTTVRKDGSSRFLPEGGDKQRAAGQIARGLPENA